MTDNQQRAAAVWDAAAPAKGGYVVTRRRLEPVITAALDAAEARSRVEERERWIARVEALANEWDREQFGASYQTAAGRLRALIAEVTT